MEQKKNRKYLIIYLAVAIVLVMIDQLTKRLVVSRLKGNEPFSIIDGVFELRYLENRGMAWGLLQGGRWLFLAVTVAVLLIIIYMMWVAPACRRYRLLKIILTVLAAGAVGNMADRIVQGYVVDFFYFSIIDFPIFNVSDCYVTVSAIALIIVLLFRYKENELDVFLPGRSKKKSGPDEDKK